MSHNNSHLEIIWLAPVIHSLLRSPKQFIHDRQDVPREIRVQLPQTGAIKWRAPGLLCNTSRIASLSVDIDNIMRGTCFKHTPNLTYAELQIKNARPALELMSIEWESRSSNEATRWFGSFLNIFDTAPSPLKNSTMVQRMPQSTFSVHIKSMTIPKSICQMVGRMTSIYF